MYGIGLWPDHYKSAEFSPSKSYKIVWMENWITVVNDNRNGNKEKTLSVVAFTIHRSETATQLY